MVSTRAGPNDWLSAEYVDSDGHAAYRLNVNVISAPAGGENVTIIGPLGTNTVAASVSVTPATASSWAITAASLPLPTGAATSALQTTISGQLPTTLGQKTAANSLSVAWASDAVGTAGSPATTVVSVQGVASGTQLFVGGTTASGTTGGSNPVGAAGRYNATLPTFTDGQRGDLQIDSRGRLIGGTFGATNLGDGVVNTSNGPVQFSGSATYAAPLSVYGSVFNGTTWDRARGDVNGTVVQQGAMAPSRWNYAAAAGGITTATSATIAAAGGASVRNYLPVWDLMWTALTTSTEFVIRDGAAGTPLWRGVIPAGVAGSLPKESCIPLKGTANTLMEIATLTNPVAGSIYFNGQGFTGT